MSTDPSFFDQIDAPDAEYDAPQPEPVAEPEVPEPAAAEPVPATIQTARDPVSGRYVHAPAAEPAAAQPAELAPPAPAAHAAHEPSKVIPLAAHLEERARWKQDMRALEERLAKLEPAAAPPAPEPDFIEDPKGYVDAKTQKALDALRQVEQRLEPVQQATEQQQFLRTVAEVEAAFVKTTPDYYEALAHLRQVRAAQIQELFPTATQEQIGQQLIAEEIGVARQLMQQGRNPSETVYRLAKTYGYAVKPAAPVAAPALPAVPRAPVADPAATLGSAGATATATVDEDEMAGVDTAEDMLTVALRERFKR